MAFTRFHDDPCRVQKYLEESTNPGRYMLNVPGNGDKPNYFDDPYVKIQKWGANLSTEKTNIESDLIGITRKLNLDTLSENNYLKYSNNNNIYNKIEYPVNSDEITGQSRSTHPAWAFREVNNFHEKINFDNNNQTTNVPNNFYYLHLDPQENTCIPFQNNISSRIVEKDYYRINHNYKKNN